MGVKVSTAPDLKSKTIVNDEGKYEALVFVKLGDYEKTYDILLDGKVVPAINQSLLASNKTHLLDILTRAVLHQPEHTQIQRS